MLSFASSPSGMLKNLSNGFYFEGEVNIGESPHGNGSIFYPNGLVLYQGQFFRGKPEGQGEQFYPNGALEYQVILKHSFFWLKKELL